MNNKWYKDAVIYEIFVRSFFDSDNDSIGDIQGIISKIDYLDNLGIDAIWVSPINSSPNKDNGYDVSDYYSINSDYGDFEDFDLLIKTCHDKNIKVLLDIVPNHTSDEHYWFKKAKKSEESEFRDYYIWRKGNNGDFPNNWMSSRTGKSVWTYTKETDSYYLHLYTKHQPDLNWENKKLRNEMYKMMKFWLDKGVDGFRLDVINKIGKEKNLPDVPDGTPYNYAEMYFENLSKTYDYIHEMKSEIKKEYPECVFIGQTSGVNIEQARKYTLDGMLDLFLQFEHTDLDKGPEGTFLDFNIKAFEKAVIKWQKAFDGDIWNTVFFGSHDLPRMVSHYGDEVLYWSKSAKMLATIQLFLRGTQVIYMGDEIGMTNVNFEHIKKYQDNRSINFYNKRINDGEDSKNVFSDIQDISRDNARYPFQWNDSEFAGFSKVEPWLKNNDNYELINVKNQVKDKESILNYYIKLIEIRKNENTLLNGKTEYYNINKNIFSYKRILNNEIIYVFGNMTEKVIDYNPKNLGKKIIGNYSDESINIRPYETSVYKKIRR